MKKIFLLIPMIVFSTIIFNGCKDDSTTSPTEPIKYGKLYLTTDPAAASIYINGKLSAKKTPATLDSLDPAVAYKISLVYAEYDSVAFNYSPKASATDTVNTPLKPNWVTVFTSDTVWEFNATGKSGIFLKLGKVISASASSKDSVDLFYRSTTFDLTSAAELPALSRATKFKIATATNLMDGKDSPVQDGTWVKSFLYSVTNYVYVFDADSHYSKLVISQKGGGTTGKPAWVILKWMYNTRVNDLNF